MADGLRVLGACPKCRGELEFRDTGETVAEAPAVEASTAEPHLVLGIPRI